MTSDDTLNECVAFLNVDIMYSITNMFVICTKCSLLALSPLCGFRFSLFLNVLANHSFCNSGLLEEFSVGEAFNIRP